MFMHMMGIPPGETTGEKVEKLNISESEGRNMGIPVSEKDLTFNVVFTPKTIRYMGFFIFTLLKWSDSSYRLVANGCPPDETAMLQRLCETDRRLSYSQLPFDHVVSLGKALTIQQKKETSPYFCCIDPDILATGPFLKGILGELNENSAVFSGPPSWLGKGENILPTNWHRMDGRHDRTTTGYFLGGTYFAIYNNKALSELLVSSQIDLRKYLWQNLPEKLRLLLEYRGLKAQVYDCGKIVNILLNESGGRLKHVESEYIHHLGGVSCDLLRNIPSRRIKKIARKAKRFYKNGTGSAKPEKIVPNKNQHEMAATRHYFLLFNALSRNKLLPEVPAFECRDVREKIMKISEHIVISYNEFKHLL